jgi:hypothetical protein
MSPSRSRLARIAQAICDADVSLEDMKHGYRCAARGCLSVGDPCVAHRQARAVTALLKPTQPPAVAGPVPLELSATAEQVTFKRGIDFVPRSTAARCRRAPGA